MAAKAKDKDKKSDPKKDKAAKAAAAKEAKAAKKAKKAEAAKKAKAKKQAKADKKKASRAPGEWTGIDRLLAFVLLANVALMAGLAFYPKDDEKPKGTQSTGQGDGQGESDKAESKQAGKQPLAPRHELWGKAQALAAKGQVGAAIDALEELLKVDTSLGPIVRRSVYLQLSYYCGLAGRAEDSRRWLRKSQSGFASGLMPSQLWQHSEDSFRDGDWSAARSWAARFLLVEAQMSDELRKKIPVAYLRLADSYRNAAREEAEAESGDQR